MKTRLLFLMALAALSLSAKEVTLRIDTQHPVRPSVPFGVPCVGYATDPLPGDEAAALACRRAGAWLFRTSKCDDATLAFCEKYGLRLVLVLDGTRKEMGQSLARLAGGPGQKVVAGIQLGADPSGGSDPTLWRHIAALARKKLPKAAILVPVKDENSALFRAMRGYCRNVTHLIVDLRDAPAPYERLHRLAEYLRNSTENDKAIPKLRLWAVGPGRLAGTPDDKASAPSALCWQMHWIMSALAEDSTAGVFIERPYRADDYGHAMRHLWATVAVARSLVGHGEGATCATFAPKPVRAPESDLLLEDESLDTLELNDPHATGPVPVACAKVAQGKTGDVEYIVFMGEDLGEEEGRPVGRRIGVFLVNTTGERVQVKVDVNRHGGNVSSGFRRRLVPDAKTGGTLNTTRMRRSYPISETVEPFEVTFFDFRFF